VDGVVEGIELGLKEGALVGVTVGGRVGMVVDGTGMQRTKEVRHITGRIIITIL